MLKLNLILRYMETIHFFSEHVFVYIRTSLYVHMGKKKTKPTHITVPTQTKAYKSNSRTKYIKSCHINIKAHIQKLNQPTCFHSVELLVEKVMLN